MVENVTVTPGDVRGGGNIVIPNKNKEEFIGVHSKIEKYTEIVDNVSETVYGCLQHFQTGYTYTTRLVFVDTPNWFDGDVTVNVELQYKTNDSRGWVTVSDSIKVYCDYNGEISSKNISQGQATFTIRPVESGLVHLKFYFKGATIETGDLRNPRREYIACFKKFTALSCNGNGEIEFMDYNHNMQIDDINHLLIQLTCNGMGIPAQLVQFYEDYIEYIIRVYSDQKNIQTGDVTGVYARLADEDGSAIKGKLVHFYEDYGDLNIIVLFDKSIIQTGETSTISARVSDGDGVVIGELIKFYEEYIPSKISISAETDVIQTGDDVEVYARVVDEDGSVIPGVDVAFYEEYDLSKVSVYADKSVIQTGDEVTVLARVSDDDGSAVPDEKVYFYEEYDLTDITVTSSKNPLVTNETSIISTRLRDEDGSLVVDERVDFTEDYDEDYNITLNVNKELVQTGETATATVTVKNGNTPVENVYIRFYDDNE